jgi:hypothetical protein
MVFSKQKYKQSKYSKMGKPLPESHLDALDGKDVIFKKMSGDRLGIVEDYEADGQEWYLYPVMPEWCEEKAQMQLSDFIPTNQL